MKFHVMTLFPQMIENGLNTSILGKAAQKGLISFEAVNMRDYTLDKHGKVDDYPYGGGAGMLIQAQPVFDTYAAVTKGMPKKPRTIYVTPKGRTFDQKMAKELADEEELVFLCGHYEGIDERVLEEIVTDYVSIGDYVLTGGELPVMVMIDAISRLVPGVLNNGASAETETFHNDLLEYPQYTRPEVWHEKRVPQVLLSGNHRNIMAWRLEQSVEKTKMCRPDLYGKYEKKQEIIKRLSKKKIQYVHIMEFLGRGIGRVYYEKELNILTGGCDVFMISASSLEGAREMLAGRPKLAEREVIVAGECGKDFLIEEYGMQVRRKCTQACYTKKEALAVSHKDIRPLEVSALDYVADRYPYAPKAYVKTRLEAGVFLGAFEGDTLLGFIGIHAEGSMGMLYVEEPYRRRGIGASLESCLINLQVSRGEIPYCQITQGNEASLALQEKLGLYTAKEPLWWLYKENGNGEGL